MPNTDPPTKTETDPKTEAPRPRDRGPIVDDAPARRSRLMNDGVNPITDPDSWID